MARVFIETPLTVDAGTYIEGGIVFDTPKPADIHGITLVVKGEECTAPRNFHKENTDSSAPANQKRILMSEIVTVVGTESTKLRKGVAIGLSAGKHVFPFRCFIPENCPSTVHVDSKNYIQYSIKARVHIKGALAKDRKAERVFFVHQHTNLHAFQNYMESKELTLESTYKQSTLVFWKQTLPVQATLSVKNSVVQPGEPFECVLDIKNMSGKKIDKVTAKFFQTIDLQAPRGTECQSEDISIQTLATDVCDGKRVLIVNPPTIPYSLTQVPLKKIPTRNNNSEQNFYASTWEHEHQNLRVQYHLHVMIYVHGTSKQLQFTVPVLVSLPCCVDLYEKSIAQPVLMSPPPTHTVLQPVFIPSPPPVQMQSPEQHHHHHYHHYNSPSMAPSVQVGGGKTFDP